MDVNEIYVCVDNPDEDLVELLKEAHRVSISNIKIEEGCITFFMDVIRKETIGEQQD